MSYYFRNEFAYDRPRITYAVQRLILANALVFAGQLVVNIGLGGGMHRLATDLAIPGGQLVDWLAFSWSGFLRGAVWTPVTYMFIHGGLLHLFLNMLWLFIFGPDVERLLGTRQFFRFYLACGGLGVLATIAPAAMPGLFGAPGLVVGASGATMGVVVAFTLHNPDREFFLFPLPIPINARGLLILIIVFNLMAGLTSSGVSVSTHFGGMIVGYAYMKAIPALRRFQAGRRIAKPPRKTRTDDPSDPVGRAVDNLFRLDEERKRRGR